MKQYWQRLELKIDAMNLRERGLIFGIAALLLIALINSTVLDPLLAKQKQYTYEVQQDQQKVASLQAEIQARVKARDVDPDEVNKVRLETLKRQSATLRNDLAGVQQGLVSPDKMAGLLEDILKKNARLRLVSLKTLPVSWLGGAAGQQAGTVGTGTSSPSSTSNPAERKPVDAVFKHSVEITVQGGYLDILHYLDQLEAMPWQLFWESATLDAKTHPEATLKLTLFTLSLDRKWLNI